MLQRKESTYVEKRYEGGSYLYERQADGCGHLGLLSLVYRLSIKGSGRLREVDDGREDNPSCISILRNRKIG